MSTITENSQNAKPEELYKKTTDRLERRRLQTAVLIGCRERVAHFVRRYVPAQHRTEAEQVGAIGVLVALEKFEPDRGAFWGFAANHVRDEVQRFLDSLSGRVRSKKGPEHAERTGDAGARLELHRRPVSLDRASTSSGDNPSNVVTLHDLLPTDAPSIEETVGEAEAEHRLKEFLATLPAEDVKLLLADRRARSEGGIEAGNNARSRRYLNLVERARAFVRGNDGHRDAVSGHHRTAWADDPPSSRSGTRG